MSALNIPGIGKRIGQHWLAVMTFGATGESPDVSIGSTSTGVVALFNVNESDVFVHSIEKQVVIAFDGATTLAFEIGDGDDSDGFWTDTLFDFASSGAVFANMASSVGYAAGKLYTGSDTIDLTITGGLTAGKAKLRIDYTLGADTDLAPATSS
jgi:hypothetical protein